MRSVFDQLDWRVDTDASTLIQLVSTQLDAQELLRQRIRQQLSKDYPPEALSWLPTVTWSAPTLVPLRSFDLAGIGSWPTWNDKAKIRRLTKKIESGWHKPIVAVKIPGARYLDTIDGHTRLSIYWKLKRPVIAWVGKTHARTGPWEGFHQQQRGMTRYQQANGFANVSDQFSSNGYDLSEPEYQELLLARRSARSQYLPGHPERVAAERAVRQARKVRDAPEPARVELTPNSNDAIEPTAQLSHPELLALRREAQSRYPAGHPERIRAERAVRKSRSRRR